MKLSYTLLLLVICLACIVVASPIEERDTHRPGNNNNHRPGSNNNHRPGNNNNHRPGSNNNHRPGNNNNHRPGNNNNHRPGNNNNHHDNNNHRPGNNNNHHVKRVDHDNNRHDNNHHDNNHHDYNHHDNNHHDNNHHDNNHHDNNHHDNNHHDNNHHDNNHHGNNNHHDKRADRWNNGYEDWQCTRRDRSGRQCVVASMERSPCARGGRYMGCDDRRRNCWKCSVNHNKNWLWEQMEHWCRGQDGWMERAGGHNWRKC